MVCGPGVAGAAVRLCDEEAGMADALETHATPDIRSGSAREPGVAYDTDRLGEPGQPGIPTGDQYPANKRDNITEDEYEASVSTRPRNSPFRPAISSELEPREAVTR
jgi:hypothetical protein